MCNMCRQSDEQWKMRQPDIIQESTFGMLNPEDSDDECECTGRNDWCSICRPRRQQRKLAVLADAVEKNRVDPVSLILCVREDLHMTPGNIAEQCCHAMFNAYRVDRTNKDMARAWHANHEATIVMHIASDADLTAVALAANEAHLETFIEIADGRQTVLVLGPACSSQLWPIASHLQPLH